MCRSDELQDKVEEAVQDMLAPIKSKEQMLFQLTTQVTAFNTLYSGFNLSLLERWFTEILILFLKMKFIRHYLNKNTIQNPTVVKTLKSPKSHFVVKPLNFLKETARLSVLTTIYAILVAPLRIKFLNLSVSEPDQQSLHVS